jgi:hypothetical protein
VANAPHIPVHLGSMQHTIRWHVDKQQGQWKEGVHSERPREREGEGEGVSERERERERGRKKVTT